LTDNSHDSSLATRGRPGSTHDDPRLLADRLFASSTLVDLLIIFCREPDRRYYVNELIRRTGRFPRSIQLALATLDGIGLVSSEREANLRYYKVVRDHLFFPDLAALVAKISDVSVILGRALGGMSSIRVAFLRPEDPDSLDLELVVIGEEAARSAVLLALNRAAPSVGRTVRPVHFSVDEWLRQARRERSYVRWLLEETRTYIVGQERDLPGP
jgi:hypothetical protein